MTSIVILTVYVRADFTCVLRADYTDSWYIANVNIVFVFLKPLLFNPLPHTPRSETIQKVHRLSCFVSLLLLMPRTK